MAGMASDNDAKMKTQALLGPNFKSREEWDDHLKLVEKMLFSKIDPRFSGALTEGQQQNYIKFHNETYGMTPWEAAGTSSPSEDAAPGTTEPAPSSSGTGAP